jgi:hypothetical protein
VALVEDDPGADLDRPSLSRGLANDRCAASPGGARPPAFEIRRGASRPPFVPDEGRDERRVDGSGGSSKSNSVLSIRVVARRIDRALT